MCSFLLYCALATTTINIRIFATLLPVQDYIGVLHKSVIGSIIFPFSEDH